MSHDHRRVARPAAATRRARCWRRLLGPCCPSCWSARVFVWFLPQFTSIADVWTSVRAMTWAEVAVLLLAALWNLATYQFVMIATMPG